ncbi:MAG: hypothetical protein JWN87_1606, partial [Frankiales bacterium]|jgi:hypothetical protein|nr:hypothetical protein [Frankiales bacterium]
MPVQFAVAARGPAARTEVSRALDRPGTTIAMALLELGRGRL